MTDLRHATLARYQGRTVVMIAWGPEVCLVRNLYEHGGVEFDVETAKLTEFGAVEETKREAEARFIREQIGRENG